MYKTFILVLLTVLFSFNVSAQEAENNAVEAIAEDATEVLTEEDYNAKIDEMANQLSEGLELAATNLNEAVTEIAPVMIDSLTEMVREMMKLMVPTMVAIQEGKKLPSANNEMAEAVKSAITQKYSSNVKYDINSEVNELKIVGEYDEGRTVLKYEISRNLAQVLLIQDMLDGNTDKGALSEEAKIENLDGESVPYSSFENFEIEGVEFIGYDDPDNETIYLMTNIGSYVSLRIQVKGEDYKKVGGEFIYSFDYDAIKTAVKDDGRSITDIQNLIDEQLENPEKLQELMSQTAM